MPNLRPPTLVSADGLGRARLGRYELVERIGAGGMAEVYRARLPGLRDKTVVIKRIRAQLAANPQFVQLFVDEARISEAVQHRNIVQILDVGHDAGQYYIVLEYVDGMDLSKLMRRAQRAGPLPLPLVLYMGTEVLKGLAYAHHRRDDRGRPIGVVHCDVSPQNILVSLRGEVKLTDFGVARSRFQRPPDEIRGKIAYLSPEQATAQALDGRSDLFSLAIVLYELLTLRRLFKAETPEQSLALICRGAVPPVRHGRPDAPPALQDWLHRALSVDRNDRWPDAHAMLDALEALTLEAGLRARSHDLANFVGPLHPATAPKAAPPPTEVVVLACEGVPQTAEASPGSLPEACRSVVASLGGTLWEDGEASLVACWAGGRWSGHLGAVQKAVSELQSRFAAAGYRLSVGVVPGMIQLPALDWELAGPFRLVRHCLHLASRRNGAAVATRMVARALGDPGPSLGWLPVRDTRSVELVALQGWLTLR